MIRRSTDAITSFQVCHVMLSYIRLLIVISKRLKMFTIRETDLIFFLNYLVSCNFELSFTRINS